LDDLGVGSVDDDSSEEASDNLDSLLNWVFVGTKSK
jgi:hypothetical protein